MDLLGLDRLTRCSALELGYLWIGFLALRAASGCNLIFHTDFSIPWVPLAWIDFAMFWFSTVGALGLSLQCYDGGFLIAGCW